MKRLFTFIIGLISLFACTHKPTAVEQAHSEAEEYINERRVQFKSDSIRLVNDIKDIKKMMPHGAERRQARLDFNERWACYLDTDPSTADDDNSLDIVFYRIIGNMHRELAEDFERKGEEAYE